ncbi:hypothetical protein ACSBQ8_11520 [Staphylococcus equorum]|uniref:hypothetical protein n=1 Tax=Staphylococcus equorum TaxID=246432 RepID=UPI003EB81956
MPHSPKNHVFASNIYTSLFSIALALLIIGFLSALGILSSFSTCVLLITTCYAIIVVAVISFILYFWIKEIKDMKKD